MVRYGKRLFLALLGRSPGDSLIAAQARTIHAQADIIAGLKTRLARAEVRRCQRCGRYRSSGPHACPKDLPF